MNVKVAVLFSLFWGSVVVICCIFQLHFMSKLRRPKGEAANPQFQLRNLSVKSTLMKSGYFVYLKQPPLDGVFRNKICSIRIDIKWKMTVFVKSEAPNFHRRELFRRTWASVSYYDGLAIRTIFVIGSSNNRLQNLLDEEYARYGDILQYVGPDDYKNIAVKTMAGMQWAAENLPPETFYSTMDDDVMVDVSAMREVMAAFNESTQREGWRGFPIFCMYKKLSDAKPIRNPESKYFTSNEEYKWTKWPDFCLGGMYSTSVNVIKQLFEISKHSKRLSMDDVWITGVLREKLGMPADMVVKPSTVVATHYQGYKEQQSEDIRGFMKFEWEKLKEKLNVSKLCLTGTVCGFS